VDRQTAALHELASRAARQAERVLVNARRALGEGGRAGARHVARLAKELTGAARVITQTATRLAGRRTIADRVISLSDLDARPIRRGKPQKPTEFGFKASVADSPEGFVVSHQVYAGNPADVHTVETAVREAQAIGMKVRTVLADRAYGNAVGDQALERLGIEDSVIPRQGTAAPIQHTRAWRRRYRYRAGAEGRISGLKRGRGWARSRLKGHAGATIWAGHGVFTHNLDRMVAPT